MLGTRNAPFLDNISKNNAESFVWSSVRGAQNFMQISGLGYLTLPEQHFTVHMLGLAAHGNQTSLNSNVTPNETRIVYLEATL